MKNILILLTLVLSTQVYAAVNAGMVWEARTTGTSGDVNSGGFDATVTSPGTDYSQQDSAQYSFTDLATTSGTTNPCVVTSASHNFVSADNGNTIHINSGGTFTASIYEIKSTSGNAATLDRACATTASTSGGTWHEGGALSLQNSFDNTFAALFQPGNTLWIKAGTYTQNISMIFTDSTATNPSAITGYNTTRGDTPTGSNRPFLNLDGSSNDFGSISVVSNLIFSGTSSAPMTSDGQMVWYNNKFINTSSSSGHFAIEPGADDLFISDELISQAGTAILVNGDMNLFGCYIHDSVVGIKEGASATATILNNIIAGNMTAGIQFTAAEVGLGLVEGNTIYGGNKTGTGISLATGASNVRIFNNIFADLSVGVSATTAGTAGWSNWNDFNNNTTNRTNWNAGANDITSAPGFANVQVISGTAGVVSGSTLTDTAANFSNVVNNQDYLDIISGAGVTTTPGSLLIVSHTATSVTVASAIGGSGTNINYIVLTGHNFAVSPTMKAKGFPGVFPGSFDDGLSWHWCCAKARVRKKGEP